MRIVVMSDGRIVAFAGTEAVYTIMATELQKYGMCVVPTPKRQ